MSVKVIKVAQVMQTSLRMVNGLATVQSALEEMVSQRISSLIIERRHDGDEYGIVTVQDIAAKVVAKNRSTVRTSVYEIMTKPALTLNPEMNIKYAVRLLARFELTRALVSGASGLEGIVTLRDLILRYSDSQIEES